MDSIMLTRRYQAPFMKWYKSLDTVLLGAICLLACIGIILIISVGASANRTSGFLNDIMPREWVLVSKQIIFVSVSLLTALVISMLDIQTMRRLGIILYLLAIPLLILTLTFLGTEINGSKRWVMGIQPSEFLKPGYIICAAWLMSLPQNSTYISGALLSLVALIIPVSILLMQTDVGQTSLLTFTWIVMFFIAGGNLLWFLIILLVAVIASLTIYNSIGYIRTRIDKHLFPEVADKLGINYQIEKAKQAFSNGGLTGRGPGEGEVKFILPEAHNDYIFAVAGEEFGVVFCWIIITVFGLLTLRLLTKTFSSPNQFTNLAGAGLAVMFGMQAFIHIGVNTGLLPSKGMTLPFVSYGGSSMVSLGFMAGFMLCLTRKNNSA